MSLVEQQTPDLDVLRVANRTPPQDLGVAVYHSLSAGKKVRLRAVGAGAVNQAVKGIVLAQTYAAQRGLTLATRPGFETIVMDDQDRTAIVFHVFVV